MLDFRSFSVNPYDMGALALAVSVNGSDVRPTLWTSSQQTHEQCHG